MSEGGLLKGKSWYRNAGADNRRRLSKEAREVFSIKIKERLFALREYKEADSVFCYMSLPDEVGTSLMLKSMLSDGKKISVPFVCGEGVMEAVEVLSLDDVETGKYGILTVKEEKRKIIDIKKLDCAIIPGTAFGRDCSRVGMGGGFYDRFLLRAGNAARIGVCFDCQLFEKLPVEKNDLFMDMVITENNVIYNEKGE